MGAAVAEEPATVRNPDSGSVSQDGPRRELRYWSLAEVRLADNFVDTPKITGYAAVFNEPSELLSDGWGFSWIEIIRHGAFAKTIKEADVRALVNHDSNYVLGRNAAGTLSLKENRRGLEVSIDPPDTQWARDLVVSMERGDVTQMSFAFSVVTDRWTEDRKAETLTRELLEVKLYDVSVVTFPAYPQTSAVARSRWLAQETGIDLDAIASTLLRTRAGSPLTCEGAECYRSAIAALTASLPIAPVPDHALGVVRLRRELELAEHQFAILKGA